MVTTCRPLYKTPKDIKRENHYFICLPEYNGSLLPVKPQDTIMIELDEWPLMGKLWEIVEIPKGLSISWQGHVGKFSSRYLDLWCGKKRFSQTQKREIAQEKRWCIEVEDCFVEGPIRLIFKENGDILDTYELLVKREENLPSSP